MAKRQATYESTRNLKKNELQSTDHFVSNQGRMCFIVEKDIKELFRIIAFMEFSTEIPYSNVLIALQTLL